MSNSQKIEELQTKLESLKESFSPGSIARSPSPIIEAIIELTNIVADIAKDQETKKDT